MGQLEIYFDLDTSSDYVIKFFVFRAVFYTILYLLMFLVLRGYKVNAGSIFLDRPAPFDENQRRTLAIILGIIAMIDEEYGVQLRGDDIRGAQTIGALYDLVQSRR